MEGDSAYSHEILEPYLVPGGLLAVPRRDCYNCELRSVYTSSGRKETVAMTGRLLGDYWAARLVTALSDRNRAGVTSK